MLTKQQKQKINWNKNNGILPVIIQDFKSGTILMLGYMNIEAFNLTEKSGYVTFFSRNKKRLWTKGEYSGNFLRTISIHIDCDYDTILIIAKPIGPTCHNNTKSCFYPTTINNMEFLFKLEKIIKSRKLSNIKTSYTSYLYIQGNKRIAQKVGEEAVEVALASISSNNQEIISESADLLYHLLVLLTNHDISLNHIIEKLRKHKSLIN